MKCIERVNQCVFLSATRRVDVRAAGLEQRRRADRAADRASSTLRSIIKPTKGQIDDLIEMVNERVAHAATEFS
jgi:hypothetical protein